MAFDPNRYTSQGAGSAGGRSPRDRLYDMMDAHQKSQKYLLGREEKVRGERAREQKKQERADTMRWADTAAQGAGVGAAFGPVGALVGGIAGSALGQGKAIKARMGEGKKWHEATAATLLDFANSVPSFSNAAPAAQAIGGAVHRDRARKQTLGGSDTAETMAAIQDRSKVGGASSLGTEPASPFSFGDADATFAGAEQEWGGTEGAGPLLGTSVGGPASIAQKPSTAGIDQMSVSLTSPSDVQIGNPYDYHGQMDAGAVSMYDADQGIGSAVSPTEEVSRFDAGRMEQARHGAEGGPMFQEYMDDLATQDLATQMANDPSAYSGGGGGGDLASLYEADVGPGSAPAPGGPAYSSPELGVDPDAAYPLTLEPGDPTQEEIMASITADIEAGKEIPQEAVEWLARVRGGVRN